MPEGIDAVEAHAVPFNARDRDLLPILQAVFNQRARLNLAGNIHINKNRFGIPEDIQREDLRNDLFTHPGKKLRTAFPFPGSDDPPELFLLIGDPRLDLSAHVFVHVFLSFLYWHPAG